MKHPNVDPNQAPSGAKAQGFADMVVNVWLVKKGDAYISSEAALIADPTMPPIYLEEAARHLLVAAALASEADFGEVVDRIAQEAKDTQGKGFKRI